VTQRSASVVIRLRNRDCDADRRSIDHRTLEEAVIFPIAPAVATTIILVTILVAAIAAQLVHVPRHGRFVT